MSHWQARSARAERNRNEIRAMEAENKVERLEDYCKRLQEAVLSISDAPTLEEAEIRLTEAERIAQEELK